MDMAIGLSWVGLTLRYDNSMITMVRYGNVTQRIIIGHVMQSSNETVDLHMSRCIMQPSTRQYTCSLDVNGTVNSTVS